MEKIRGRKKTLKDRIVVSISTEKEYLNVIDDYCYQNRIERSNFLIKTALELIKNKK